MKKTINLPPSPTMMINAIRSFGYSFSSAVADIIDNSIAANASRIDIVTLTRGDSPYLAIIDNGDGMDKDELINAMTFGSDRKDKDEKDLKNLGRFGMGLKSASLAFCRELVVITKKQ